MNVMEGRKYQMEVNVNESASSPISQKASTVDANSTTTPLSPSEFSPPPAPASTTADPSQPVKSPPPLISPPSNVSSSNSSAPKLDPGAGQIGSPPNASSPPSPVIIASPLPPPPALLQLPENTPPPLISTPTQPYPNFSPPPIPQYPSPDSKEPPPPANRVFTPPPTRGPLNFLPPPQAVTPVIPTAPSVPVPSNSPIPINTSPSIPLTPGASTSQNMPSKPSPFTPSGGETPRIDPQGTSASGNRDTFATAPSSSNVSSSSGVIITAAVFGVVIVMVVVLLVALTKRKRRMNGLERKYKPAPTNSIDKIDGDFNRKASNLGGDHFQATGYDVSGLQFPPYAAEISYQTLGKYDYLAGTAEATGAKCCFTYEELMGITNGFSEENKIGEGGFGSVYRGCLPDGRTVAVKQLKVGSGQGEREFKAEVEIISRVHHRHLVSLVGYCISENHRILVYEFVSNKTLEHHLHGNNQLSLDWEKRLRIALGSARGLVYLHEYCHPRIIHRDIKSANILLDNSFEAMVADFGLAKLANDTTSHVSTRVVGTFGYMAPEYAASGKLMDKSDVYSFGVVLLELISGRKPVDRSRALGEESLVEWARPHLVHALETGECDELVDPMLDKSFPKSEMLRMIEVAASCVRHSAAKRPRMAQVLRALENGDEVIDISNGVKLGESVAYNSSQYSADIRRFQRLAFDTQELSPVFDPSKEHRQVKLTFE